MGKLYIVRIKKGMWKSPARTAFCKALLISHLSFAHIAGGIKFSYLRRLNYAKSFYSIT